MVYIVSYDLNKEGQAYKKLIEEIKLSPGWACLGGSAYLIDSQENVVQLRDRLIHHLDGNDQLFVCKLERDAAWVGLSKEVSDWIKKYL